MEQREQRSPRETLRTILVDFPQIMQGEPQTWAPAIARRIQQIRHELSNMPPATREHLVPILERARRALREESTSVLRREARAQGQDFRPEALTGEERAMRAERHLLEISEEMARQFESKVEPVREQVIRVEELLQNHPSALRMREDKQKHLRVLELKHPDREEWFDLPMPPGDTMWHKGGPARAVLLVHTLKECHTPAEREGIKQRLASELPWADFDVAYTGDEQQAMRDAARMGVDAQGVERLSKETFDFARFCLSRDTIQNQVCLGNDGLHFSNAGFFAARTGLTMISGQYLAEKAIYGSDMYIYDGRDAQGNHYHLKLANPRGQMRLVKAVAEEKAYAFPYRKIETQFDFGVYALHLARKWFGRDDFGLRMQNMFALLQRMEQTREGEHEVYALLDRVHRHYPFMDIEAQMSGIVDITRWKAEKFIKQLDKEFAWRYGLPASIQLTINSPRDAFPKLINLDGFTPSTQEAERITNEWEQFAGRCQRRTDAFYRLHPNPYEHYFYEDIDRLALFI